MKSIIRNILFILPVLVSFCLLMNSLLMAQAPGGDDGDHKAKPGYKIAESTEIDKSNKTLAAPGQSVATDAEAQNLREMLLTSLIGKFKGTKEVIEKRKYAAAIASKVPANQKEIDVLFTLLEDDSTLFEPQPDGVRDSVLESMQKISNPALGANFAKRLKRGSLSSRAVAVAMVGRLKNNEAVPDLINLVDNYANWNEKVKKEGATKSEMAEHMISMAAATSLGEIGDERAIPALLRQLGTMNGEEEQALAKFGRKALPELLVVVRSSKNEDTSCSAGYAIINMKDKELIPQIWQILKDEKDKARYVALEMLLNSTDKTTSPTNDEVMDYVVVNATQNYGMQAEAIIIAKKRRNVDYLIKAFQNPKIDHGWRTGAIQYLGELKAQSAVPALEAALKDSDTEIRYFAAIALYQITGKDYGVKWP